MEQDMKREARKQYLRYFRFWFIAIGILTVIFLAVLIPKMMENPAVRKNSQAPAERVYDYADVMTDEEEQKLREYIAVCEESAKLDIVLVTVNEAMESPDCSWEDAMMNAADDFYDEKQFGYNKVHGDGVLLLDNWYEGQAGSWLTTCGNAYMKFTSEETNKVLDEVYYQVEENPYQAYKAYVDEVVRFMSVEEDASIPISFILIVSFVVALIYALCHLNQSKARDTTTVTQYVSGGKPNLQNASDDFIRKHVVTRRIERNTGSSGGSRGGSGGHHSSSGVSHGGGGRRR